MYVYAKALLASLKHPSQLYHCIAHSQSLSHIQANTIVVSGLIHSAQRARSAMKQGARWQYSYCAMTRKLARDESLAPVTAPPDATTCWSSCIVSCCKTSPGIANGTPGGYGHRSSALTLPTASAAGTLHHNGIFHVCSAWCEDVMLY